MCFKQLNLDRSRFQDCVNEFFGDAETKMVQQTQIMWEIRRTVDNKEMILQFFFIKDGRTTLGYKVGKHQEVSRRLAEFIKEKTLVDSRHNIHLSFKDFSQNSLDETITYLSLVPGVKLAEDQKNATGQRILRFTGHQNDTVTLVYHSNSTLQLQGKPVTLYCQIIAFLSEYLSLGDIIESQSKFISVPIKIDDIEYELDSRMPYAHSKLDQTTRKMLATSIAFTKLNIALPDYTAFVFPALRALEGHLKSLFYSKGIAIIGRNSFGPHFYYTGGKHSLNHDACRTISCPRTCSAIELSYNYYNNHRHSLFHAEVVPVTSSIIEDRNVAVKIIETVIEKIEKSHQILSN